MRIGLVLIPALLVSPALTGCGGASADADSSRQAERKPPVSVAEATDIVRRYDEANNAANARYDTAALHQIETAPAVVTSEARLVQARALRQTVEQVTHPPRQVVIPRTTGYPRWFVALAPVVKSGAATPRAKYLLFVQDAAKGPWRVAYYPYPADDNVSVALDVSPDGGAPLVTDARGLAADPAQLNQAIYDHYEGNGDGPVRLAPTVALEQQLTNGFRLGQQQMKARGVTFVRKFVQTTYPSYLIRMADGGVLAFTAGAVLDTLTAAAPGGQVTLDPNTPEAATLGKPDGAHAHTFTMDRLQMFLSYIPPAGAAATVQLLAYDDAVLAVR
jgi:hypothetical protein